MSSGTVVVRGVRVLPSPDYPREPAAYPRPQERVRDYVFAGPGDVIGEDVDPCVSAWGSGEWWCE